VCSSRPLRASLRSRRSTRALPSKPLVGCKPKRAAVAHHASAKLLATQPHAAPIPCTSDTGLTAIDAVLAIGPQGQLLFSPAGSGATAITSSADNGATWKVASFPSSPSGSLIHPWLWRDEVSGRVFWNGFAYGKGVNKCPGKSGPYLWWSDDLGKSWESHTVGCDSQDYGKIITGPAATAASRAALAKNGYPSVVYFCATGPTILIGPNRFCYRSLDGGKTFVRTATDAVDSNAGQRGWPEAGAIAPDGSIYVAHVSDQGLAISISRDEGDNWKDSFIPKSSCNGNTNQNWLSMNAATDEDGNVYATWVDDRDLLPYVSVSRDRGSSWSAPLMVGAPGVKHARYPNIGVRKPGYVAVAYYGSADAKGNGQDGYFNSDGRAYDAWLTVTSDLFAKQPLFWSARMNDPESPAIPNGISFGVSEYLGAPVFAPDGSAWAGFVHALHGLAARLTPLPTAQ
jgi:hypothetical protein